MRLLRDGRELTAEEAGEVVERVRASAGPRRALERAHELASEAQAQLHELRGDEAIGALATLATYVVSRKL
jgi:geranylgeranyl pyrophosphate synthase